MASYGRGPEVPSFRLHLMASRRAVLRTGRPDSAGRSPRASRALRYTRDGRLTIDNSPAEQALRPLAVGRKNWLHLGGDGGLRPTAVLLSVAGSVKRHGINPWVYIKHVLTELPSRSPGSELADLLSDIWTNPAPSRPRPQSKPSCRHEPLPVSK
jgi:hypothetical protein